MKQTAVEWLVKELNKSIGLTKFVDTCDEDYKQEILEIIEKAKEMEKEQIIQAFCCGGDGESEAEIYYNEMFKSE